MPDHDIKIEIKKHLPAVEKIRTTKELQRSVDGHGDEPKSLLAYERGYYRNGQYFNTFFNIFPELKTDDLVKEFDTVVLYFADLLPTLESESKYAAENCDENPVNQTYNLYAETEHGYFMIQFVLTPGYYNRRILCFDKQLTDELVK